MIASLTDIRTGRVIRLLILAGAFEGALAACRSPAASSTRSGDDPTVGPSEPPPPSGADASPGSESGSGDAPGADLAAEKNEQETRPDLEGLVPATGVTVVEADARRDGVIEGSIRVAARAGQFAGLVVRLSSEGFHLVRVRVRAGSYLLEHGTVREEAFNPIASVPIANGEGVLKVAVAGPDFSIHWNGQAVLSTRTDRLPGAGASGWTSSGVDVENIRTDRPIRFALRSYWGNCQTTPRETATGDGDDFGPWSEGLITSAWNGQPWSCLQARVSSPATSPFRVRLGIAWGQCSTAEQASGWSEETETFGAASPGIVTSEWDGAPWSCLTAQVASPRRCRLHLKSRWAHDCTTGEVTTSLETTSQVTPEGTLLSPWSDPLVTSEWNGQPWSCLSVRLECAK